MDRLFVLEGADITNLLLEQEFELVRTYKGDIERSQTGVIKTFPVSFVTLGMSLVFLGPREQITLVQQTLFSADTVKVKTTFSGVVSTAGTTISGKFSCTSMKVEEQRDKATSLLKLEVSLVSDGTDIGDAAGTPFNVRVDGNIVGTAYFGKVYKLSAPCKKPVPGTSIYMNVPDNKILVFEPEYLISQ